MDNFQYIDKFWIVIYLYEDGTIGWASAQKMSRRDAIDNAARWCSEGTTAVVMELTDAIKGYRKPNLQNKVPIFYQDLDKRGP